MSFFPIHYLRAYSSMVFVLEVQKTIFEALCSKIPERLLLPRSQCMVAQQAAAGQREAEKKKNEEGVPPSHMP
jgi:hypothetical protein